MNKTTAIKASDIKRDWIFVDAAGQTLGRLATEVSRHLTGKNKATFSTHMNVGDKVVITNASKISVTGKKLTDKEYIWYTGFPGGLRSKSLGQRLEANASDVVRDAIKGMLPKNRLQQDRLNNLYVYNGAEHPHTAQMKGKK